MKAVFLVVAILITSQAWSNICSEENADLNRFKHELAELRARQVEVDQKIESHEEAVEQQCQSTSSDDPAQPLPERGSWQAALDPHIPEQAGAVNVIPRTDITSVLLPDDGTPACTYLKCNRSHVGLNDWVGWSFDEKNGVIRLIAMGGHADLGANSVYEFSIASLSWTRVHDYDQPAEPFPDLSNHDPDGDGINECVSLKDGPFGTHTYDGLVHIPTINASLMVRSTGYSPNWGCERDYDLYPATMWLWSDIGGWTDKSIPDWSFPKTAYDTARDKVYIASQSGVNGDDALWEMDPHTFEFTKLAGFWNGKGGAMAFDPESRELWVYGRGSGLYTIHIAEDGTHSDINKVVPAEDWRDDAFNAGLAVSKGVVVGWKGGNDFIHYNSETGQVEEIIASGETLDTTGSSRILGKFDAVPGRPGVFIGMSDNWGLVLYKAF